MRRTVLEDMTQPTLMMTQQLHTLGERMVRFVGGDPGLALHRHREYPYYLYKSPSPPYPYSDPASSGQESHSTSLAIDSYGSQAAPVIDMTEEKFYPPQADTYPNALHIIPAPDAHQAIESVTSDSRNNEAVIGQLKNCEVLAIHKNNGFEGSDLDADTDQLSGIVGTSDMGNQEQENTAQKPSGSDPEQTNPEKYLNNDQETLKKVINNPVFYEDTQPLKIDL